MRFPKKLGYLVHEKASDYTCFGLDLSATHCGIAVVSIECNSIFLMSLKSIERNKYCTDKGFADDIVNELNSLKAVKKGICEGVYLKIFKVGKRVTVNVREYNRILRIQGMVEYGSIYPIDYIQAVHARKVVGANPQANKAEIQVLIYKTLYNKQLPIFKNVEDLRSDYKKKKMCKATFKKRANKLSQDIYHITQINEHKADAVVLALSHVLEIGG